MKRFILFPFSPTHNPSPYFFQRNFVTDTLIVPDSASPLPWVPRCVASLCINAVHSIVPHRIHAELGQLGFTVVSIQTGHNPQIYSDSCRRWCIAGASFPGNSVYILLGPQSLHQCHWCQLSQGLWENYTVRWTAMWFPTPRANHSTGLRVRKRGVSDSGGIKAKLGRHVRGRLGGGWGGHSSLWCDVLWCVLCEASDTWRHLPCTSAEVLQTCPISKASWCWGTLFS